MLLAIACIEDRNPTLLTFHFNKDAWDAFAKELRRASWGGGAIAAAIGLQASSGAAAALGCATWTALQIAAIVVESIKVGENKR